MGSQQLLIITLIVFVVGLAAMTGIRLTRSYSQSSERDQVFQQMSILVGEARKHYARPTAIGGGEGSFVGFEPPSRFTVKERIRIYMTVGDDWILFQGFGIVEGYDGATSVQIVAQYRESLKDWESITEVN